MMKITYATFALLATFALVGTSVVNAQMLDASGAFNLNAGTNIGADESETGVSTDVQATTSVTTGTEESSMMATGTEMGTTEPSSLLSFSLSRSDVNDSTEYNIQDAVNVRTTAGLESYVGSSIRDDERLESAALENDSLEVTYKTDAKFLGFIPGSMNVTAVTSADGSVEVRYPWYAFLMSSYETRSELETRLTNEQASIRNEVSASTNEAQQWAFMLERLRVSLYAGATADARI